MLYFMHVLDDLTSTTLRRLRKRNMGPQLSWRFFSYGPKRTWGQSCNVSSLDVIVHSISIEMHNTFVMSDQIASLVNSNSKT